MTIQEFIEKQIHNLAEFKCLWRLKRMPDDMSYPDWQDRFRDYSEELWEEENDT